MTLNLDVRKPALVGVQQIPDAGGPSTPAAFGIQRPMLRHLYASLIVFALLIGGCALAQAPAPTTSNGASHKAAAIDDDLFPPHLPSGKVSLARGVLERFDLIHDQLVIRTFGGGDMRISFDVNTKLLPDSSDARLASVRPGSVLSVDTVIQDGKLFANSVWVGTSRLAELDGQVIGYDPARSRLTLRDPISPETVYLRVTPDTTVVKRGLSAPLQSMSPGTLVRVWFSAKNVAKEVEILAEPGNSFTFEGRIIAVDLRSRILSLSNDSDQSLHDLAFDSLDSGNFSLLREGADVTIQAEFDGNRYEVRSVALASPNP